MSEKPRVRIAPSPTGDPHVGTAYVALFNRAFADAGDGVFLLRIDDTDRARYRKDSEAAIGRALRWLGINWDEGPDCGGPYAPYRQSERTDRYREAVQRLIDGGRAYRCFCTAERLEAMRAEQREKKLDPGYDGACRDLPQETIEEQLATGVAHVVRLRVPEEGATSFVDQLRGPITVENKRIDDQVLLKSDGFPTYHLASVADDSAMKITHVVRAEEWLISTPKHVLIYEGLGVPLPLFFHVPLLRNADKSKISKRKNPVSLDYYREQGYLPEALVNFLAHLGWSPPEEKDFFDYAYFRDHFRLEDINLGGPVFDLTKLKWLNGVHIRALEPAELTVRLRAGGFLPPSASAEQVARIMPLVGERLHLLSDFHELTDWFFEGVGELDLAGLTPKKLECVDGVRLLGALADGFGQLEEWETGALETRLEEIRETLGLKKPQVYMPLRMALTGKANSPPLPDVLAVLGREEAVSRLAHARSTLEAGA